MILLIVLVIIIVSTVIYLTMKRKREGIMPNPTNRTLDTTYHKNFLGGDFHRLRKI